jgi:tripartite-type tricarboxylate transporter receptor subunit TctC
MTRSWTRIASGLLGLAGFAALAGPAAAQGTDPFGGKPVTLVIGFGPGGGYDIWGRTVARHMTKHLPGKPNIVPQNMPGAGSLLAANHVYNTAPKDGTVFGIIARDVAVADLTGMEGARFDGTKMSWIGSPASETSVCLAFHTAKVKTAKDLQQTELVVGTVGVGTGTYTYPKALSSLMGMKFKLVSGFPSSSDVFLAMERGEVDGICESLESAVGRKPDWVRDKKINFLFQGGAEPNSKIKDVPFIMDLAQTEEQKQALLFLYAGQGIGRPFVAPPGLPPERLKMLRDAFSATMKDPEFLADVERQKLELDPKSGEELEALVKRLYTTPKAVIQKVGELVK